MVTTHGTVELEVATPLGLALRAKADSVQAPSVSGEFGVLSEHLPLLASMKAGVLKYRVDGKNHFAAVGPGFVEVEPHQVEVLTDSFVKPETIDAAAVQKELSDLEDKLKRSTDELEAKQIALAIEWARARLDARAEANK